MSDDDEVGGIVEALNLSELGIGLLCKFCLSFWWFAKFVACAFGPIKIKLNLPHLEVHVLRCRKWEMRWREWGIDPLEIHIMLQYVNFYY